MHRLFAVAAGVAMLSACGVTKPPAEVAVELPTAWYAPPLPHQGSSGDLATWWSQFDDPVLSQWIARAQAQSPNLAAAQAQLAAARAAVSAAQSLAGPQAALVGSAARGQSSLTAPLGTHLAAGLQVSWVPDLWGRSAAGIAQARAQQDMAQAGWHEARVLVAAETAQLYYGQRLCQAQLAVAARDRDSRLATAHSSAVAERAGLLAPAVAALARASSAESAARTQQQSEQCERQIKALVALTAVPEPELRAQLAGVPGLPSHERLRAMLAVEAVPAAVIRQRPDVLRAQRELVAASEGVGVARSALWPSISLSGSVLRNRFTGASGSTDFNTWSVGPFALSLPLLGRSALSAYADAAQVRFDAAGTAYAATLRRAVAEVEQSLVTLSGLQQRVASTETAVAGYTQSFAATEARHRVGLASLPELEESRRLKLQADSSAVALLQERINAWITLYIALGGGFDPQDLNASQSTP